MKKALILVDIQNDFCPGGNLAVNEGDQVVPLANQLINSKKYDLIVATQDFHPKNHKSFASNNPGKKVGEMGKLAGQDQVMWPDHCVQGTKGVDFHKDLDMSNVDKVFQKGTNPEVDSYSGFYDNDKRSSTGMGEWLLSQGVTHVDVVGLALDYCVKATAQDANKLGFKTKVILNATRAVNIDKNDGQRAIDELKLEGVEVK